MSVSTTSSRTVERLYVLNAGIAVAPDRAVYTPGKWQGEQVTLTCNAYLIRRAGQWTLWDTGIDDAIGRESGGRVIAHNIRGIVVRTIACQLADIGITPADVSRVILSHAHFDHVGNARLFTHATWHMQRREHEAMFGPDYAQHGYTPPLYADLARAQVELMDGDHDIFGDGSVQVISTPGHTLGHCSLLVRLPKSGPVLLSGDVAHDSYNMVHRCVPTMNADAEASRQSMARIAAIVHAEQAQLWLNHDTVQSATIPHAPAHFD
ncbi:N-acyl homoserine lactonase family protein [Bradyrhizobium sp. HKCCYLS1011]|uniref:N-acyl homoserine lactonase family protein n=1 Tax=Bradyrhizobium sp. HKCCYLS1011 TaxID=3420733 RepID=UPI003EBDA782